MGFFGGCINGCRTLFLALYLLLQSCLPPSPLSLTALWGAVGGRVGGGISGAWTGTTHAGVSLCLPADDCLWGFLAQGLLLPELLQHLGPASGQRVPHLLWHPVSRSPQPCGHATRNGCQDMKSLQRPPAPIHGSAV